MTTSLTFTSGPGPAGTVVVKAVGEIDMSNSDALAAALDDIPGRLVLDLTEVEYLDSAGLSVLFGHADRIELVTTSLLEPVVAISGLAEMTTVRIVEDSSEHGRRP
ncbi:STAS domain-containing protein [Lentzea sp. DG1S-22]|uniref:STAS domain-containing protein n=1 Tax=Lentzea sp. DG1S-22 TaxID=3108822 RepID=UPI002E7666D2|nr:STAS domain-containing protein [Lentzea sp. DG1S-22]WVH82341.1 STAS domain-containing protein [Lentzea sp. DG1S-22]